MFKTGDTASRLRLLRYGLIVMVIVAFLVSWLVPYVYTNPVASGLNAVAEAVNTPERTDINLFTFLPGALLYTLGAAVVAVGVYFAYRWWLTRGIAQTSTSAAS